MINHARARQITMNVSDVLNEIYKNFPFSIVIVFYSEPKGSVLKVVCRIIT